MKSNYQAISYLWIILVPTLLMGQEYHTAIDVRLQYPAQAVSIDGTPTLYYELNLINHSHDTIFIEALEILDQKGSSLLLLNQQDLDARLSLIGKEKEKVMPPGSAAILYLECSIKDETRSLEHKITYRLNSPQEPKTYQVSGISYAIERSDPIVLGAPLKGGPWVAIYDPAWERGHRRVVYTVNGKARIPGRFAIDFMKLDSHGRYATGDQDLVKNYYGFEEEVLAVSEGTIATIKNDFPDSRKVSKHPRYSPRQATGNYISIDLGNGLFAFYEHLRKGSIRVQPGQRVKKGDVIAQLGFTGQSTGPHLHFHVADKNSPLGAESVPFVFETFEIRGFFENLQNFGKKGWTHMERENRKLERPGPNTVIRFD